MASKEQRKQTGNSPEGKSRKTNQKIREWKLGDGLNSRGAQRPIFKSNEGVCETHSNGIWE